MVVVVVRELLFLVTSVICVGVRGRGSEVTTTLYHFRSDFRLTVTAVARKTTNKQTNKQTKQTVILPKVQVAGYT